MKGLILLVLISLIACKKEQLNNRKPSIHKYQTEEGIKPKPHK